MQTYISHYDMKNTQIIRVLKFPTKKILLQLHPEDVKK